MNHDSSDSAKEFLAEVRQKIDVAIEQLERGESIPAAEVFRELRQRNGRRSRAKHLPKLRSDSDSR